MNQLPSSHLLGPNPDKSSRIQHWDNIPKVKWAPYKKVQSVTDIFEQSKTLPYNSSLAALQRIYNRIGSQVQSDLPVDPVGDVYNILADVDILRIGYAQIKNNKVALTPGSTPDTADDFSTKKLYDLSNQLRAGSFTWNPIRRIYVEKPGKPEKRPLGLPDFQDKVVQAAMRIVLETIFEPIFEKQNHNFGFRPRKDPNGAIEKIRGLAQGTYYAVEGDIKGAYNDVNHNVLMEILSGYIKDKKFLNLVRSALKAGMMEDGVYYDIFLGIPQGGIVSPLLFNIYMYTFDLFAQNELPNLISPSAQPTQVSPDYERNRSIVRRIDRIMEEIKDVTQIKPDPFFEFGSQSLYLKNLFPNDPIFLEKINKIRNLSSSDPRARVTLSNWRTSFKKYVVDRLFSSEKSNLYTEYIQFLTKVRREADSVRATTTYLAKKPLKMAYIRYANDWVIFTSGDKDIAEAIKLQVSRFLKDVLHLTLSLFKTRITHLHSSKVQFLGFENYFPTNVAEILLPLGVILSARFSTLFSYRK